MYVESPPVADDHAPRSWVASAVRYTGASDQSESRSAKRVWRAIAGGGMESVLYI